MICLFILVLDKMQLFIALQACQGLMRRLLRRSAAKGRRKLRRLSDKNERLLSENSIRACSHHPNSRILRDFCVGQDVFSHRNTCCISSENAAFRRKDRERRGLRGSVNTLKYLKGYTFCQIDVANIRCSLGSGSDFQNRLM